MIYRILCLFLALWTLEAASYAQTDDRYLRAREQAHAGRYQQAEEMLRKVLLEHPEHYDALFLQALLTAWKGSYQPALRQLNVLQRQHGSTQEILEAITRINYWAGENIKAIVAAEKGLALYPDNLTLMYVRAQALAAEEAYDEAIVGLQTLLQQSPEHQEAQALLKRLQVLKLTNTVGVEYVHARFTNSFSPWNQLTAFYKKQLPSTLLIGRLRYAHMFNQQGMQAEVDAYPKINNNTYAYLNAGISSATIFPGFRWGAELYRELPQQWEASAGMRGLYFENAPVHVYTAQLGRYLPGYWLSGRGFLTRLKNSQHLTGMLTARRYLENEDHFVSLYMGNGATPLQVNSLLEIQRIEASWVGMDYQHPLQERTWLLRCALEFQKEVYPEVRSTNRFTASFQLEKRF